MIQRAEKASGKAPAKVNLHLSITGKREDGYHSLCSLFQMISLYDDISVCSLKEDKIFIEGNDKVPVEEDLTARAARLLKQEMGLKEGVHIRMIKRIPKGAGLGGGSSDAAFVLKALNLLWDLGLSSQELSLLGIKLGSDIPFFINHPCAIVKGKGEILEAVDSRVDYMYLLLKPDLFISTKEVYQWLDLEDSFDNPDPKVLVSNYRRNPPKSWGFYNSFYSVLIKRYPIFSSLIRKLYDLGAEYAGISGSGSTIFGVFITEESCKRAQEGIYGNFYTEIFSPLARMPSIILE